MILDYIQLRSTLSFVKTVLLHIKDNGENCMNCFTNYFHIHSIPQILYLVALSYFQEWKKMFEKNICDNWGSKSENNA